MTQDRLNGLATAATLSIDCEMDGKLDFTTIIHDFADKSRKCFIGALYKLFINNFIVFLFPGDPKYSMAWARNPLKDLYILHFI